MTSTVMLRVIYGAAIAGLLIACGYLLGFQMLKQPCSPDSHWVTYSGEKTDVMNFFGPDTEELKEAANFLMRANVQSLYGTSRESRHRTIRMTQWGVGAVPTAAIVLTIVEDREGVFKADVKLAVLSWDQKRSLQTVEILEDRHLRLTAAHSVKLRTLLSARYAWRGCKDLRFWQKFDRPNVFIIEESDRGRYRMLVQDLLGYSGNVDFWTGKADEWYVRSFNLFNDLTVTTQAHLLLLQPFIQSRRRDRQFH